MKYTSFLRWTLLIGLAAVPFISFIIASGGAIPSMFFPFITGKNFAFRILIELLLLAYVILALREPKYRPKASLLMWVTCGFVLWMALATFMSVDGLKSFWSNFERMDGYITVIHVFVLFVIAGAMLTAEKWWDTFFKVSIAASALQGVIALFQLMGILAISSQSGPRVDTTFGNAIYVAVFMLFNIFITLYLLVRERESKMLQAVYGVALVLQFLGLYYSETRGALLGVVGGIVVALIYIALRASGGEWKTLRLWSFGLLGAMVILAGLFFALKDSSFVRNSATLSRVASISLSDRTTQSRFVLWKDMAIPGAMEKPLFGWGQENFNFVFNKYYVPSLYDQEQWFDRTHNEFLDWLVAGGVPAFVLYLALYVLAAWAIIRSELSVPEQAMFLGLLAAYGFSSLTVFHDLMSFAYFFLIIAFAHSLSFKPLPRWMIFSKPMNDQMLAIAAPIAAVIILGGAWYFNADGLARAQTIIAAIQPNDPSTGATITPAQHLASFKVALTEGDLGKQEVVEQLFQFASNTVAPATDIDPTTKQDVYNTALTAGTDLLAQRKNDARLELFMSVFLSQFSQYDDAIAHLKNAVALSPQKQQILFQLGAVYLQKGDVIDAVPVFKQAFDLAPSYETARILYAGSLYYAEQDAAADKLLTDAFGTVLYDNDQLLQVYTNTKQWDRVIGIWKERVEKTPNDANVHLGLASAYFTSGDAADTIAELKKIETLSPSMAAQAEQLITQIQNGTLKPGQ